MAEKAAVYAKTSEPKQQSSSLCKQESGINNSGFLADRILHLQRTAGNQAVQRLIRSGVLQAKLKIGQPNDMYEQEADRVAEQVMRMPEPQVQRKCNKCKKKLELLQPKAASSAINSVPPVVHDVLRSPGQPLDAQTRAFMEPRLGHDFSQVRVHTDARAAVSAQTVSAHAYTVGQDVVFGEGQYSPTTVSGRRLLAHELAHTIQQGDGQITRLQRTCAQHSNEDFYMNAHNYCRDTGFSGSLHHGQRCYREVPRRTSYFKCPPGDQVCFDANGRCQDSFDRVSTVESKNSDGSCNLHWICFFGHAGADIIPGFLEERRRMQVECLKSCVTLPFYMRGFCERRCLGIPRR